MLNTFIDFISIFFPIQGYIIKSKNNNDKKYNLKIFKDNLTLDLIDTYKKNNIKLEFKTNNIYLNHIKMPQEYLLKFADQIKKIVDDINKGKTTVLKGINKNG